MSFRMASLESSLSAFLKSLPVDVNFNICSFGSHHSFLWDRSATRPLPKRRRLFSLGIGRDVSHALIDGLARVGRGFSQVVSAEREGMEGKVTRMLRGGLSGHIVNYRLEWEGKPSPEEVNLRSLSPATSATHRIH